jgi:hypothetical protein
MRWVQLVACMGLACGETPEDDGTTTFSLTLSQSQPVPHCDQAVGESTGTVSVKVDSQDNIINVDLRYSGTTGTPTAIHLHVGAPGVRGPEVLTVSPPGRSPIADFFLEGHYPANPPAGAPATFKEFVTLLRAGGAYVDLHTEMCPNGELRGQID